MKSKRLALVGIASVLLAAGCPRGSERKASRHVEVKDVLGTWRITPAGLEALKAGGLLTGLVPERHTIVLRDRGSCEMETVLKTCVDPRDKDPAWVSRAMPCAWSLEKRDDAQTVNISIARAGATDHVSYALTEVDGRLLLYDTVCDPKDKRYLELEKLP